MMRRAVLFAIPALLLACTSAHAQVTLGRLFATPAERTTLDANRGASATLAPNSQGQPVTPAGAPPGMPPPGMAATASNEPPPPPPALVMSGILRRSDNHTTVWLNDQPQYGVQRSTSQRKGAATPNVTVTLPSGKKVTLKAGQRYDLNEGRIKDIDEP